MQSLLFPNSFGLSHNGFDVEVVPEKCDDFRSHLNSLREQVLVVATRSRGWEDDATLAHMRAHFKMEPLYEADSLVLIRRGADLVGLAGGVGNWHTEGGSILHLCSLGLLPEAQRRGFLPVLLSIGLITMLGRPRVSADYAAGRAYVTAITQSPYIYALLNDVLEIYPSFERPTVPEEIRRVGRQVVQRFDAHLELDEDRLVLTNECRFFYRKVPYSRNRECNAFCDRHLRYGDGDVFVLVGRIVPNNLDRYVERSFRTHEELFTALQEGLQSFTARQQEALENCRVPNHV